MSKGFFITGTDTGAGKTVITGAVICALKACGINACGMKPFETGCRRQGSRLIPEDGLFIKGISEMDEEIKHITPYCFETPAAPLVASKIEGIDIDLSLVVSEFSGLAAKYGTVIVEGAGGILVPLKRNYFISDLIRDLGLPAIVVTKPSLGAINHSLLTVKYALHEGLEVAGIAINFCMPPDNSLAERTNPEMIRELSPVPVIGLFPHLEPPDYMNIRAAASRHLDANTLKKRLLRD